MVHGRPTASTSLARRELAPLIALLVLAGTLLAFALLASLVSAGDTHAIDRAALLALREPTDMAQPIGPHWVENVFVNLTSLGSSVVLVLVGLLAVGFLLVTGKPGAACLVIAAVAGGELLTTLLKLGFERPRPELVAHLVEVRTMSFPSGHALNAAATYLTLGALLARFQQRRRVRLYLLMAAILLTTLVGASRVFLGVHWPTDVLAGWCIGAAWAALCWLVAYRLQQRGRIERPAGDITVDREAA